MVVFMDLILIFYIVGGKEKMEKKKKKNGPEKKKLILNITTGSNSFLQVTDLVRVMFPFNRITVMI